MTKPGRRFTRRAGDCSNNASLGAVIGPLQLFAQIARILKINDPSVITENVVDAGARDATLVIGAT